MQEFYLTDPVGRRDFYWDMVKRLDHIERGLDEHMTAKKPEFYTLKGLAFAGLILGGEPFEKNYRQKITTEEKVRNFGIIQFSQQQENTEPDELWILIRDDRREEYFLEGEVLKYALGPSEYNRIVLGIEPVLQEEEKTNIGVGEYIDEWIKEPVDYDDDDGDDDVVEEVKKAEKKERLPEFVTDTRYPEDDPGRKNGWSFWYNRHQLTIPMELGTAYAMFYVYPLAILKDDGTPDIFVAAESGGMVRAGCSRGDQSYVEIDFEGIKFWVRGQWKNGEFESFVRCMEQDYAKVISEEIRDFAPEREDRMADTYVRIRKNDAWINIFPARYGDNESNGFALAAVAVEVPEHFGANGEKLPKNITIVTPQEDGTFELDTGDGMPTHLDTYWFGDDPAYFRYDLD